MDAVLESWLWKAGNTGAVTVTASQSLLGEQDHDLNKSGLQTPHRSGKSLLPLPQPGKIPHSSTAHTDPTVMLASRISGICTALGCKLRNNKDIKQFHIAAKGIFLSASPTFPFPSRIWSLIRHCWLLSALKNLWKYTFSPPKNPFQLLCSLFK